MRICVVGAGPSGLSLVGRLLKKIENCKVNIVDARSVPFGLVKYGVAPDHPEVKNTINSEKVAFFGGVEVGKSVTLQDLKRLHDAVVVCTGMPQPRLLNIPGEKTKNSFNSSELVGWYNGDPKFGEHSVCLNGVSRVAIIGHGNVALDVARILLKPWKSFENTEISKSALEELKESTVKQVDIIGRRGPLQVSFTVAELREMFKLDDLEFKTDQKIVKECLEKYAPVWKPHRQTRRLMEVLFENSLKRESGVANALNRKWSIKYFQSPKVIGGPKCVEYVDFEEMQPCDIDTTSSIESIRSMPVVGTGIITRQSYDMVVSCVGFKGSYTFGLPADKNGAIESSGGRVIGNSGVYVCGWAAGGPAGELAATFQNARDTADIILSDYIDKDLPDTNTPELESYFKELGVTFTRFNHL